LDRKTRHVPGTYRDQAFILDRWSKRWVVYYTDRSEKTDIRKHV
jgi:hypothetical protein